ncbi:unnamed protein product [Protopolystoma xenopodis]|uniref:Uncharacterized protein n=1 Tax=Protopolystoma xenopodis TaxID=117903 RepID=A0A3S4ZS34_9PLAT|nr:unnamed protein product [Protopolystoma xenopodis]
MSGTCLGVCWLRRVLAISKFSVGGFCILAEGVISGIESSHGTMCYNSAFHIVEVPHELVLILWIPSNLPNKSVHNRQPLRRSTWSVNFNRVLSNVITEKTKEQIRTFVNLLTRVQIKITVMRQVVRVRITGAFIYSLGTDLLTAAYYFQRVAEFLL